MKDSTKCMLELVVFLARKSDALSDLANWNERDESLSPLMNYLGEVRIIIDNCLDLERLILRKLGERDAERRGLPPAPFVPDLEETDANTD